MKATAIVGMVLGILGGIVALLIGAVGFGLASAGGGFSGTIGYNAGVATASFYQVTSIFFPVLVILGAGLTPKSTVLSALFQGVGAIGILTSFGLNLASIVPCILVGLGIFFVLLDSAATAQVASRPSIKLNPEPAFQFGEHPFGGITLNYGFLRSSAIIAFALVVSGGVLDYFDGLLWSILRWSIDLTNLPFLVLGIMRRPATILSSSILILLVLSAFQLLTNPGYFVYSFVEYRGLILMFSCISALISFYVLRGRIASGIWPIFLAACAGATFFGAMTDLRGTLWAYNAHITGTENYLTFGWFLHELMLLPEHVLVNGVLTTAVVWLLRKQRPNRLTPFFAPNT